MPKNEPIFQSHVIGVELDPEMIRVAHEYFDLPAENERLRVVLDDALVFLENTAKNGVGMVYFGSM